MLPEQGKPEGLSHATRLELHMTNDPCPWCPEDVRSLYAVAYNAFVNYGSGRERKTMDRLGRVLNELEAQINRHFQEEPCPPAAGCYTAPGGRFHKPGCPRYCGPPKVIEDA